jgi:long-chain acyl-CoA synthetase
MEKLWYKVWPANVPKSVEIPLLTLHEVLSQTAKRYPDKTFITYENRQYSYKEIDEDSDKLACALSKLGLSKGDKVAICMFNSPEWIKAFYGALKVGLSVVAIDALETGVDLLYQLRDSQPKVIITDKEVYEREREVLKQIDAYKIVTQFVENPLPNTFEFHTFIGERYTASPNIKIDPKEDVALILYYAGIVGRTEQVFHTHYSLLATAIQASTFLQIEEKDCGLLVVPLGHIFGILLFLIATCTGGSIVLMKRFEVERTLSAIKHHGVTYCAGVPTMYTKLSETSPEALSEVFKSVKWCISGGAPLPKDAYDKFDKLGIPILQIYGMTECPWVTTVPLNRRVYNSIGIPICNVDVKIVDAETGEKELGVNEVGVLMIRSPSAFKGYSSSEDTKYAIRNGWIYSGDLVKMDEDGMLYFMGVKKRIIKYKGYPVFPRDLEYILTQHPAVKKCRVVGIPKPDVGEIPAAYVVLKEEYKGKINADEIMKFVNERVSPIKAIRKLEFVEELS